MKAIRSITSLIDESLVWERKGDIGAALNQAQEALEMALEDGQSGEIAAALVSVARFRYRLQQYPEALALAHQALTLAAPDAPARADALMMLGMCAADTQTLSEAEEYYRNAADLAYEIGEHLLRFRALHNLGTTIYLPRGQFDLALAASREALRLLREQRMDEWLSYPLITLAWIYQYTGQVQEARQVLDELCQAECIAAVTQGYCPNTLALLALDEGDLESARHLFDHARAVAETTGDQGLGIEMRMGMSRYHRLAGNAAAARDWADDALTLARRTDKKQEQGQALIERSRAAWQLDEWAAAEADLRSAMEIAAPLQANFDLARAAFFLAALFQGQHRPEARQAWLEAARRIINGGYAFLLTQERALAYPLVAEHLNEPDADAAALAATLLAHLERVPAPPLQISTLGRFEVRQGKQAVPEKAWRQRRAGELFRLLLVSRGRSLNRDQIIDLLWPDKPPGAANTPFHQATSALRRALEPDLPEKFPSRYLVVEAGQVSLRLPPGSWLDYETFEQHCREAQWQQAVALYQGELLPEDRYADWTATPRQRLTQQFVAASLALASQEMAAGQPQEALAAARRGLELEPWQENLVLLAMQACLALNDRAGALRLYRDLEQALHRDLGIAPQVELQTLYRSICCS